MIYQMSTIYVTPNNIQHSLTKDEVAQCSSLDSESNSAVLSADQPIVLCSNGRHLPMALTPSLQWVTASYMFMLD